MALDLFASDELVSMNNVNNRITAINDMFPVSVANGGTGATTATNARTNLAVMTCVQLYYNASGTRSTVPLSDTINNYSILEVFYTNTDENEFNSLKIWNNGGTTFKSDLFTPTPYVLSNEYRMKIKSSQITITGTSITWGTETYVTFKSDATTVGNYSGQAQAKIYKVVGYKY